MERKYWKDPRFQRQLINKIKFKRDMVEKKSLAAEVTDNLIEDMTGKEYEVSREQEVTREKEPVKEAQMYIELADGMVASVEIADLSFGQRDVEAQKNIEDEVKQQNK